MKRITIKFLSVLILILSVFIFVGCKDDEIRLGPEAPKVVTLSKNNVELVLCDSITLTASYGEVDGANLTFSSSNTSVATVTQDGFVTAENVGTATITASYNGNTATCVVSVITNGMLPSVEPIANISDTVVIDANGSVDFEASVVFNGVSREGGEITYTLADDAVGTLEGSVFTPTTVGETSVTITGEWKGIDSPMLTKTYNVKVINDVQLSINNGMTSELRLYVVGEHAGVEYPTSSPFAVNAAENGEAREVNVAVVEGDGEVISYNQETQTVEAKGYGTAKIEITFDANGGQIRKVVDVFVERPVATYATPIKFFSAQEGVLPVADIFGEEVEISEAYCGDEKLTVSNNNVFGVPSLRNAMTKKEIRVYSTANVGYDVTLEVYTRVINSADELKKTLDLSNGDIDGYFVLGNDIIDPDFDAANPVAKANFCGVFDGLGHKVTVKVTNTNGLFGRFGINAVVKNVAFTDIVLAAQSETDGVCLLAARANGPTAAFPLKVDNVYISIKDFNTKYDGSRTAVLMESNYAYVKLTNVIIDVTAPKETELTNSYGYGALYLRDGYTAKESPKDYTTTYYNNVFVLTENLMPMAKYVDGVEEITAANNLLPFNYVRYAGNDLPEKDRVLATKVGDNFYGARLAYDNVKRYNTISDMKADTKNSYMTFDTAYWDLSTGIPVWKGLETNVIKSTVNGVENRYLELNTVANDTINAVSKVEFGLNANGLEISDVVYGVVSDDGVIAINADTNEIFALKGGDAIVTATFTYNGATHTKEVLYIHVVDANDLIKTTVNGELANETEIYSVKNDGLGFANEASLGLDSAGYELVNVAYSVSEGEDVVSVDANGKVTAFKAGNATIAITYNIKIDETGATTETAEKYVQIEVIGSEDYVYVTVGGDDLYIDTTAVKLETSATFGLNANGFTLENVSYALTSGEALADFDPTTHVITAKTTIGIAEVTVTFTLAGSEFTKVVNVAIVPETEKYQGEALLFSADDHGANDGITEALFGEGAEILVALDMDGKSLKVENGLIVGLEANEDGTVKNVQLQVFSAEKGYIVDFVVYTKVIRTNEDFLKYANGLDGKTKLAMTRTGSFILANDIGTAEAPVKAHRSQRNIYTFAGTLDGNGHTVYLSVGYYSLFDRITSTTVVKNISFIVKDYQYTKVAKGFQYTTLFAWSVVEEGYTFENVYIKYATDRTHDNLPYNPVLIAQERPVGSTSKFKNIIIEFEDDYEYNLTMEFGVIYKTDKSGVDGSDMFENVNVITTCKFIIKMSTALVWYAQNDSAVKESYDARMGDAEPTNDPLKADVHYVAGKMYQSYQYGYTGTAEGKEPTKARVINRYDDLATMYQDTAAQQVGNWKLAATTEGEETTYSIAWTATVVEEAEQA